MKEKLCVGLVIVSLCLMSGTAWAGDGRVRSAQIAGPWWGLAAHLVDLVDLVESWLGFGGEKVQLAQPSGGASSLDCTVSIDPNGACQPFSGGPSGGTSSLDCGSSIDPTGACHP